MWPTTIAPFLREELTDHLLWWTGLSLLFGRFEAPKNSVSIGPHIVTGLYILISHRSHD